MFCVNWPWYSGQEGIDWMQIIYTPNTEKWKSILTLWDTSALPHRLLVKYPTCGIKTVSAVKAMLKSEKLNYTSLESIRLFILEILPILELIWECVRENGFPGLRHSTTESPLLLKIYYTAPSRNISEESLAIGQWCTLGSNRCCSLGERGMRRAPTCTK